jgi:hypothetical protein
MDDLTFDLWRHLLMCWLQLQLGTQNTSYATEVVENSEAQFLKTLKFKICFS